MDPPYPMTMPKPKPPAAARRTAPAAIPLLEQRVAAAFGSLTASERRLSEVVLTLRDELSSYTASELAKRAGVSNATAARFFQRLGYASYTQMRRDLRDRRIEGSPLAGLTSADQRHQRSFRDHVARDVQNLTRTAEALNLDDSRRAIDLLRRARVVWVVGFRNSMALASYARAVLITAKSDVRLLPMAGMTVAEDLASLHPRDVVLAFGFRRRPAILQDILAMAQGAGTPSVLITDLSAGTTAATAAVVLRCETDNGGPYDSYTAAMSLINYLCGVEQSRSPAAAERMGRIEQLHDSLHSFAPASPKGGGDTLG